MSIVTTFAQKRLKQIQKQKPIDEMQEQFWKGYLAGAMRQESEAQKDADKEWGNGVSL